MSGSVAAGGDEEGRVVYGLDERPPTGRAVVYAFQHIFAMIVGSITGAVVIGTTIGLDDAAIGRLVGIINVAVGIATIAQVRWGVRLPVIQGSTSGHLPAYLALGSVGVALFQDATLTMQYIVGALLVGGVMEAAIGFGNVIPRLRRFVSPIAVGIVIMMVGLGLWPLVNDFIGDAWGVAIAVFVLVLVFSFAFGTTARTMAVFLAVIVGYGAAAAGTALGWFGAGHALHVDFGAIAAAPWFQAPTPFAWGAPRFDVGFILAMTIPYFATIFESFGDYLAVARSSGVETPSPRRISRGIATEGLASALSAILGGTATSSFSQNVGVVRLTGVASLFVCVLAGAILIALGIFGKLGATLGAVPRSILGAVYLVVFGVLVMTGLRLVLRARVTTSRNEAIIGTALLLGLALPAYVRENPIEAGETGVRVLANTFLATPMMVSGLWALVLDNLIPGTDEERGLVGWLEPSPGKP
ncbi:MAG TPA: solute carrier family 23 protein [Candidatus Thermoplasmatota archaeon]|nr:solute carrier family 23 protein [Candidatus Thermoplasmatota archaeon]